MAMSVSSLKGKIHDNLVAAFGSAYDDSMLLKFSEAVAQAVYDEITQNATVPATGTVTSGAGAGGGVVTTGTVT